MTSSPPGSDVIACVVDGCTWAHVEPHIDPRINSGTLAEVFGINTFVTHAVNTRLRNVEDALAAHFATHTDQEWVRTIARLRAENETLRQRIGE